MILAIDIGNTNIVIGCIDREKTYFIEIKIVALAGLGDYSPSSASDAT